MVPYVSPADIGFTSLEVLPFLKGLPWNNLALGYVHSLRPSSIRVTEGSVKLDARMWRVTVIVDKDEIIQEITQEVEVGLYGWQHGGALDDELHHRLEGGKSQQPAEHDWEDKAFSHCPYIPLSASNANPETGFTLFRELTPIDDDGEPEWPKYSDKGDIIVEVTGPGTVYQWDIDGSSCLGGSTQYVNEGIGVAFFVDEYVEEIDGPGIWIIKGVNGQYNRGDGWSTDDDEDWYYDECRLATKEEAREIVG
jgi:hypothetical protein